MAHKGVVGLVALGVGAHMANERLKEWEVEKEREEREQQIRDERDKYSQRQEELRRKRTQNKRGGGGDGGKFPDEFIGKAFSSRVHIHIEDILYELAVKVGEEGNPPRNENLQQLNLPLLSNEFDREDLMLAAAFALGDTDVVDRVVQSLEKQKLGLGLKKFTAKCIRHIIEVFQSLEDPDISYTMLSIFTSLGVYNSDFHTSEPKIVFLKKNHQYSQTLQKWRSLQKWGKTFGFYVSHESLLYEPKRGSQKAMQRLRVRHDFDEDLSNLGEGRVILSNFCCPFECPLNPDEDGNLSYSFDRVLLTGKERYHKRFSPDIDAIATALASKIAAGVVKHAVTRLTRLLLLMRHDQSVSHDHIAVHSGNSSHFLQNIREQDMNMILTHSDKIAFTLQTILQSNVPPPDKSAVKEGLSPSTHRTREISLFVAAFTQLVNLSYCEVPLLSGKPPSSYVPEYCVYGEAIREDKDCPWEPLPLMVHATRRLLEKAERQKLMDSRHVVFPGKVYCSLFIVFTWAFSSWLCIASVGRILQYLYHMHSAIFLHAISQFFTLWLLHSLVGIFRRIFRLREESPSMAVVSCCTEYIHRTIAARLGKPTPYDQEMARLRGICRSQYREWKLRIARRDFQEALKRKRITTRESVLLLTEFAENYYETAEEEVVEGVLPRSEAEAFLKLEVEEKAPSDEFTTLCSNETMTSPSSLAPYNTVKSYLENEMGASESSNLSSIECLNALAETVSECVQFSIGDRIVVDFDKKIGDENGCPASNNGDGDDDDSNQENKDSACLCPFCSMISERVGKMTASVVVFSATLCFVHLDGEPALMPIPVPIHFCSKLDENPCLALKDTGTTSVAALVEDVSDAEDESVDMNEEEDGHMSVQLDNNPVPQTQEKRARTVEEALVEGGWEFRRSKKHVKYSRRVRLSDGQHTEQNMTLAKTPSDWRAEKNALAQLRRLDEGVTAEEEEDKEYMHCSLCKKLKQCSDFSKNQLRKRTKLKCKQCVSAI